MKSLAGDALSGSKSAVEFFNMETLDVTKVSSWFLSTVSFITFGEGGKIGIDLFLLFISFDVSIVMHFSTVGVLLLLRFRSIFRYIYAAFCFGLFIEK